MTRPKRAPGRLVSLLEHAEQRFSGLEANRALYEAKATLDRTVGRSVVVELVLADDPEQAWADLVERHVPRLLLHLEAKRISPKSAALLISIWHQELLFLLPAPTFWRELQTLKGRDQLFLPKPS